MVLSLLVLALSLVTLTLLALLLRRRLRDAEERAARTIARLRRRHTTLTDRAAEVGREVAALYGEAEAAHPLPTPDR